MNYPYMPKSTALWLIENTSLTFEQIADFCGMHELEIKNLADAESNKIQGLDPVLAGQLTREDIKAAEADPTIRLTLAQNIIDAQNMTRIFATLLIIVGCLTHLQAADSFVSFQNSSWFSYLIA